MRERDTTQMIKQTRFEQINLGIWVGFFSYQKVCNFL